MDDNTQIQKSKVKVQNLQNQDVPAVGQNPMMQAITSSQSQIPNDGNIQSTVPTTPDPISTPHKEMGPIGGTVQEYITPSEVEPTIPMEVAEHGVEAIVNPEVPSLPEEVKQAGVEPAKDVTPVVTNPQGTVHLPMTIQEAKKTVKFHKKIGDSLYWLATLILKQAKVMHRKINAIE